MLKKKIFLLTIVLGSCTAGITQAIVVPTDTATTNNGAVITCDSKFNCTTELDNTTYNGLIINKSDSYLGNAFWNSDNILSYVFGYTSNNSLLQKVYSGNLFTSPYTGAISYTNTICDYLPNKGSLDYNSWISDYSGIPIESYTVNGYATAGCVCANYGTGIDSVCFQLYGYQTNWGIDSDFGITGPISRDKLNNITYGTTPFAGGSNNSGAIEGTSTEICPPIKFQISMYGYKYNTGLCYTNSIEFTGGQVIQVTPQTIFEIFTGYQEYVNRYNLYTNNCHAPYTAEHCNEVMSSNWKAKQIFDKIENAGVDSMKTYQYCHLQLDFTEEEKRNKGICELTDEELYATGVNQTNSNPNPLEALTNALEEGTQEIAIPNTGTIRDDILPEGVISRKNLATNVDLMKSMVSLGGKFLNIFIQREIQYENGIIPYYISSLIILLLLFKIYKK